LLVAAAVLFSTGGAAIKTAHLTGWQIASLRSGIAAAFLLIAIPGARRKWSARTIPTAAAYAATLILFVLANRLTTSANAIFLQATAPLYVLLLGPLLLHEPIRRSDFFTIAAIGVGMSLFFVGSESALATAPQPARGNIFALASGITYALMLAGLRWMSRHGDPHAGVSTVVAGNLLAFATALLPALPFSNVTASDAAVLLYLGIAQVGIAYWCLTRGLQEVPAFEAITLLQLEVALNPVWSWLIHGEQPPARALLGGAIIVTATLFNTWKHARSSKPSV